VTLRRGRGDADNRQTFWACVLWSYNCRIGGKGAAMGGAGRGEAQRMFSDIGDISSIQADGAPPWFWRPAARRAKAASG
jgi:hypothetical protein